MNPDKIKLVLKSFFIKAWEYIKAARVELIVLAAVLAFDLIIKSIIEAAIPLHDSVTVIPKFLYFTHHRNENAAFGSNFGLDKLFGQNGVRIFFIVMAFLATIAFLYAMYRFRGKHLFSRLCFALIIAGTMGNLVDRIAFGYVRDFVEIMYFGCKIFGSYSFAIWNIADAALVVGVIMFAVYFLFMYKPLSAQFTGPVEQFVKSDGSYSPKEGEFVNEEDKKAYNARIKEERRILRSGGSIIRHYDENGNLEATGEAGKDEAPPAAENKGGEE